MGILNSAIQSIAVERAASTCKIEKIHSEVTESVADDLVEIAGNHVMSESVEDIDAEELEELLKELPSDAEMEKEEIARILATEDDDIDIDDIVGVVSNAE